MSEWIDPIERYRLRLRELEARARAGEVDALQLLREVHAELDRLAADLPQPDQNPVEAELLSSITDGLLVIDQQWRFVYVNQRAAANVGYTPAQMLGQNLWQAFPRLLGSDIEREFRRVMDGGAPETFDFQGSDGRWYSVSVYPTLSGISINWRDRSTEKRVELMRDANIERLGRLVEISAQILACKTPVEVLEIAAESCLALTAARSSAALYTTPDGQMAQIHAGEAQAAFTGPFSRFQASGIFQELLQRPATLRLSREQLRADPHWLGDPADALPLENLSGASLTDATGKSIGMLLATGNQGGEFSIEDEYLLMQVASLASLALQNLRANRLAHDQASELDAVFESANDALIVYDRQGNVTRANPAARRLFGGDYLSMNPVNPDAVRFQLFSQDGQPVNPGMLPFHSAGLSGQPTGWMNFRCQFSDGRQIELNVSGSPLMDSGGQFNGVITIWHDITDLEQARRRAEQEANRAGLLAEELNSVFAAMTDAVMVFNQQGEPIRLNPAARDLYDFEVTQSPLEETLSRIQLRNLDGRAYTVEELPSRRALRGEIVVSEPAIQVRPDGSDQMILSSAAPVFDSSGRITGSVVVWHNLTETEHIDMFYRRQREILERIIEQAPVGIALLDGPEHRFSLANKEIHAIARGKGEVIGRTVGEIWPELAHQIVPILDHVYATGEPYQVENMLMRVVSDQGPENVYFCFRYTPLKGSREQVDTILALFWETTAEVSSRMELEQERAFLKAVIDSAPMAIVMVDANAHVLATNPVAEQMFDRQTPSAHHPSPRTMLQLFHADGTPYDPRTLPLTRSALDGESYHDHELAIQWPDGQARVLVVNSAPIINASGERIGAVGVFDDITDYQRATGHDRFLAELGQDLLQHTRPAEIFSLVTHRLREHLGLDRVMLNEVDQASGEIEVHADQREGLPPLPDPFNFSLFPKRLVADFRYGQPIWSADVLADERLGDVNEDLARHGFRAIVLHPRKQDDHTTLSMNASSATPRAWKEDELVLIGSVTDLAWLALERSRLLQDLSAGEQRYRRLFDSNMIGVTYSYLDGKVVEANDAFLAIIGYSRRDLERGEIDWRALTPPEYLPLDSQAVAESMERGYCTPFEKEYLRKDGGRVPVMIGFSPLDETASQFVCFALDMSQQKHYREALRESQKRLEMALRGSPVGMFTQDTRLRYTWIFNPHPAIAPESLLGRTDSDHFSAEDAVLLGGIKRQVMASRQGQRLDVTLHIGKDVLIQDLTVEPQIDERGEVIGVVCLAVDVTERYRMEGEMRHKAAQVEVQHTILQHREQERLQIARDLHDGLLQELLGISLALGDMRQENQDASLTRLGQMQATLNQQIQDLRAFCTDLRPPALAPFGVEKALRSFIESFQERNPGLEIHLDLISDGRKLNDVVRLTIFRIAQELLNNVARHSHAGQVWVSFSCTPEGSAPEWARLEVRDDGRGFQPPDRWIYMAREGHFGLVGIQERVEAVNGRLEVETAPGKGTRIAVSIPLVNNPAIEGKIDL